MIHVLYNAGIVLGIVGGILAGILIDQKYISKPAPEIVTVETVRQVPYPASLEVSCSTCFNQCRHTFRDKLRGVSK